MIDALYSDRILGLAANMPRAGRLANPDASAERVSKLCGSRVTVDVMVEDGRVADFAQDVKACALGQASAAVLGAHAVGASDTNPADVFDGREGGSGEQVGERGGGGRDEVQRHL